VRPSGGPRPGPARRPGRGPAGRCFNVRAFIPWPALNGRRRAAGSCASRSPAMASPLGWRCFKYAAVSDRRMDKASATRTPDSPIAGRLTHSVARGKAGRQKGAPASSFEERYPHVASWVEDGWIEIGRDDCARPFVRALDIGGLVWEGDGPYASIDAALRARRRNRCLARGDSLRDKGYPSGRGWDGPGPQIHTYGQRPCIRRRPRRCAIAQSMLDL
jgi:hypothetical protein